MVSRLCFAFVAGALLTSLLPDTCGPFHPQIKRSHALWIDPNVHPQNEGVETNFGPAPVKFARDLAACGTSVQLAHDLLSLLPNAE